MILIVDDTAENLISLRKVLEKHNFEVDEATSGEEALKKLEHDIVYSNTEVKSTEESEQTDTLQEDDRIVFLRHTDVCLYMRLS